MEDSDAFMFRIRYCTLVLGLALFGCVSVFGFVSSYARMAWKVANYNALKREADSLRTRYRNLQKMVNETNVQLASLQTLASEISVATGFKQKMEGPTSICGGRHAGAHLFGIAAGILLPAVGLRIQAERVFADASTPTRSPASGR